MSIKHVHEYRDGELARQITGAIKKIATHDMRLMEVCGTHTMSIFRHGIRSVLPRQITLLSGPGCPVCVTSQRDIDCFIALASFENTIVTTFGDLMRVPGTVSSLQQEKAKGCDVRIVYSVFDAVEIAAQNPDREVVFCAVGFETTTPTVAASILMADQRHISNFSIHSAHKTTPAALGALMETPGVKIDGFLLPGHVSVITGTSGYKEVFERYRVPSVIAGFEPVDILTAVLMLARQYESKAPALENAYARAVAEEGNMKAKEIMARVFEPCDATWRGIGVIPQSGMALKPAFSSFDALGRFDLKVVDSGEPKGCACGEILMGLRTPESCPLYKRSCTPAHPVGPCMVSSEGSCAAFYRYQG
ncbi:HypD [Desulforapulum autotrophicum HRM2]|uniref:HypD n=1 Tax=Desulforapulum autotrophicum (strain ATCC 43914 / DSM 3382 / VKM B-1955 / HRM2) TaxID=177437 RepID=C0QLW7_DESAH|nr:hydrogenase formation protein HypD [Desulforapulum autotrophicum]ACN14273.1 HypD [Desulforapulum autotrophicum HRM2]